MKVEGIPKKAYESVNWVGDLINVCRYHHVLFILISFRIMRLAL